MAERERKRLALCPIKICLLVDCVVFVMMHGIIIIALPCFFLSSSPLHCGVCAVCADHHHICRFYSQEIFLINNNKLYDLFATWNEWDILSLTVFVVSRRWRWWFHFVFFFLQHCAEQCRERVYHSAFLFITHLWNVRIALIAFANQTRDILPYEQKRNVLKLGVRAICTKGHN